jgi:hypothetical protein
MWGIRIPHATIDPIEHETTTKDTEMTDTTTPDDYVVTDERAQMLANHAIYVQGGFSDPATERARAEKDMADGGKPIDWAKMTAEVDEAIRARLAAMPAGPAPTPPAAPAPAPTAPGTTPSGALQRVDVTAVLANVDQGEALRDRIKKLTAELKVHEDMVKDMLGDNVIGVDSAGKIVVRYPHKTRSGLNKSKVKERMDPADYAECETVTPYRTLLYGEG